MPFWKIQVIKRSSYIWLPSNGWELDSTSERNCMEECVDILENHRISKEQINGQRDEEELDMLIQYQFSQFLKSRFTNLLIKGKYPRYIKQ